MDEKSLSLTEKPRWEIFVATKLEEMRVDKKFHQHVIKGIELFLPMMIVLIPLIIASFFEEKK